jgi:Uma2 family endonuclease
MSVTTKAIASESGGETRIALPGLGWQIYEKWVDSLPAGSPVRMAFDGRNLEIMVKGPVHEDFRSLLGRFVEEVATELEIPMIGLGETTWKRPEIERGLEADQCYFFDPGKIAAVNDALARKSNEVADYPSPDLAIEVDISPSQVDRPGIYAALRVPEIWRFDGETLLIERLDPNGSYSDAGTSLWLPVGATDVVRWIIGEDARDRGRWARGLRAWITTELARDRRGELGD